MTVQTQVRIDTDIKRQASEIFASLGLDMSTAVNLFLHQCVLRKGLPFSIELPSKPVCLDDITKEELEEEIMKGVQDFEDGNVFTSDEVREIVKKAINK